MADGLQPAQSQSQTQHQSVLVRIQASSDPALEQRIFTEVASAGRQLGRMSDVLCLLIEDYERRLSGTIEPQAASRIAAFAEMRAQIAAEKAARTPDHIIEALDALRHSDPQTYLAVADRLRAYLQAGAPDVGATREGDAGPAASAVGLP